MDKYVYKNLCQDYSDFLDFLRSFTPLIGDGLDLYMCGFSEKDQGKILNFLRKKTTTGNNGEGDVSGYSLVEYLDLEFNDKEVLLHYLVHLVSTTPEPEMVELLNNLVESIEDYLVNLNKDIEETKTYVPEYISESLVFPYIASEIPTFLTKVYNLRQFAYQRSLNPSYFPTTQVSVDTSMFENLPSETQLSSLYSAGNFYQLEKEQVLALLQVTANEYLRNNNVEPCAVVLKDMPFNNNSITYGEYNPNDGVIYINSNVLNMFDRAKAKNNQYLPYQLLSTVIHEAHHRVQFANLSASATNIKDMAVTKALLTPQDAMNYNSYLGLPDEIDARNASLAYIRDCAEKTNSPALAQFYNEKKKQEMKNGKTDIPEELKAYFSDVYDNKLLDVDKKYTKNMLGYKSYLNIIKNMDTLSEEPNS